MGQSPDLVRALYYGDNLHILRTHLATESIDLIYLDPPFYSQRIYQASFKKALDNQHNRAQAFTDVWRWSPTVEQSYADLLARAPEPLLRTMAALSEILGRGSLFAYLVMMAVRLVELHRVLKPTGSVYLHCAPVASHYLKVLMDAVFGAVCFRNEIVWGYKTGGASQRHFARKHDLIFFYSKSEDYVFHVLKEKSYMMHRYGFKKSTFLHDARGEYTWVYMKDVWDLPALGAADKQRLGYPTQKPEALLERIIQASSDEGAVVLDPFCGSGTTLAVAQRLGRGWLGIENHYLGIAYQRYRLSEAFPDLRCTLIGVPTTLEEARALAHRSLAQFRWWALSLVCARPIGGEDQGRQILERSSFHGQLLANAGERAHFLVTVVEKADKATMRRFVALLQTDDVPGLLIIALEEPTREIRSGLARRPASAVKIELVTIADLL